MDESESRHPLMHGIQEDAELVVELMDNGLPKSWIDRTFRSRMVPAYVGALVLFSALNNVSFTSMAQVDIIHFPTSPKLSFTILFVCRACRTTPFLFQWFLFWRTY